MSQLISVTLAVTASQLAQIAVIMGGGAATGEPEKPAGRSRRTAETETETKAEPKVTGKDKGGEEVPEVPSKEDVTKAAQALSAANGREALIEMLGKFDAKNISGIADEDRQKFIDACEKATK